MLKARDIMTKDVIFVHPDTEIVEAARLLIEKHINGLPVVTEEGIMAGIICQEDLVTQQRKIPLPSYFILLDTPIPLRSQSEIEKEVKKMAAFTVAEAMTTDVITVDSETELDEIATLMVTHNIHTIPVVDKGKLAGIIGKEDILKTLMPGQKKML